MSYVSNNLYYTCNWCGLEILSSEVPIHVIGISIRSRSNKVSPNEPIELDFCSLACAKEWFASLTNVVDYV